MAAAETGVRKGVCVVKMDDFRNLPGPGRKIAVVGSGISGLACAWLLSREHRVTLFEAADRVGGHTNTVDVTLEGVTHPVDTGFLVFNRRTYPNLCALFALLGVQAVETEMSFSVSLAGLDLEWAGSDLNTVFAQRRNLLRPAMWGMIGDILRFNRETTRMAQRGERCALSLGAYLDSRGYGQAFRDWYLLPMAAAIWSCPADAMLAYPVETFVRFCHNHGLLQIINRPRWLTVKGGGRAYVERLLAGIEDVRLSTPVRGVSRNARGVRLFTPQGAEQFEEVVLACHSDQALEILGSSATADERSVLEAIHYQPNRAVLHTDRSLLPRRERVWSAWNYFAEVSGASAGQAVSVSYLINRLQPLPFSTPVVVSLNPLREPAADTVLARFDYAHPVFDRAALDAQSRLAGIQGVERVWFAGAWAGYGFHEDGLKSALEVVQALGGTVPWRSQPADGTRRASVPVECRAVA